MILYVSIFLLGSMFLSQVSSCSNSSVPDCPRLFWVQTIGSYAIYLDVGVAVPSQMSISRSSLHQVPRPHSDSLWSSSKRGSGRGNCTMSCEDGPKVWNVLKFFNVWCGLPRGMPSDFQKVGRCSIACNVSTQLQKLSVFRIDLLFRQISDQRGNSNGFSVPESGDDCYLEPWSPLWNCGTRNPSEWTLHHSLHSSIIWYVWLYICIRICQICL